MEKYPKRIRFPQAETSNEILDLPSKAQRQSYPHPPEKRMCGEKTGTEDKTEKREK